MVRVGERSAPAGPRQTGQDVGNDPLTIRRSTRRRARLLAGSAAAALSLAAGAKAQEAEPELNFYGVTGALDTPTADMPDDGQIMATVSHFGSLTRSTLSFQVLPRVQTSFRYARFGGLNFSGYDDYYDRSFDLSIQLLKERRFLPSVKLGFQDFVGTGILSGEYIVATKHVTPSVKVSAGLGWGRLASTNDIGVPFGEREDIEIGEGGGLNAGQWFRGPAAPFASVIWQATPKLALMAEYSSDAYVTETGREPSRNTTPILDRESDFSFGASYSISPTVELGLAYLYGSEIGVNLNFSLNPKVYPQGGTLENAPPPVEVRPVRAADPEAWATDWTEEPRNAGILRAAVAKALATEEMALVALDVSANRAVVSFVNPTYQHEPQALGRVARVLTRILPASVERFELQPVVSGIPTTRMIVRRSDIEALEHAPEGGTAIFAASALAAPVPIEPDALLEEQYPELIYGLGVYRRLSYFDPNSPLRGEIGLELAAAYAFKPGLSVQGSLRQRLIGNISEADNEPDEFLPEVRTDSPAYNRATDLSIHSLTGSYHFVAAPDVFGRVTLGYFERMFGGASAELLWAPTGSRFAFGAEVTYAKKRDYDQKFGFQDYDTVTAFLSGYAELGNGFTGQLDVGRYLAQDVGATLTIGREFANGWSIAAFATKTDITAEEFGPGSFDKGIVVEVPIGYFTGTLTRSRFSTTLRTFQRNGGARVNVSERLYDTVHDYRSHSLEPQWERFLQ